jgi:hypothetical protein
LNASLMNFGPLDLKDRRLCGTVAPGRVDAIGSRDGKE